MKQTMAYKILARAAGKTSVKAGEVILPKVEIVACLDTMAFIDTFEKKGYKIWEPSRMVVCFDHSFQPDWMYPAVKVHPKIRKFVRDQGIPPENFYDIGRNEFRITFRSSRAGRFPARYAWGWIRKARPWARPTALRCRVSRSCRCC